MLQSFKRGRTLKRARAFFPLKRATAAERRATSAALLRGGVRTCLAERFDFSASLRLSQRAPAKNRKAQILSSFYSVAVSRWVGEVGG